jgi:hypothetical protein
MNELQQIIHPTHAGLMATFILRLAQPEPSGTTCRSKTSSQPPTPASFTAAPAPQSPSRHEDPGALSLHQFQEAAELLFAELEWYEEFISRYASRACGCTECHNDCPAPLFAD